MITRCCHVNRWAQLNTSVGKIWCTPEIPKDCKAFVVAFESGIGVTGFSITPPINPPITRPAAKNRFHNCCFQLYFRKSIFPGKQAAQICLKLLDIPSILLPASIRRGTVKPIIGPATYHGHGWRRKSNRFKIFFFIRMQNYLKMAKQDSDFSIKINNRLFLFCTKHDLVTRILNIFVTFFSDKKWIGFGCCNGF